MNVISYEIIFSNWALKFLIEFNTLYKNIKSFWNKNFKYYNSGTYSLSKFD